MIVKYFCLGFTNTYNWKILHLKTHHISESQRAWAKQPPAEKPHTDMSEANSCSAQHAARRGYAPLLGEPEKERAKRKVRPRHAAPAQRSSRGTTKRDISAVPAQAPRSRTCGQRQPGAASAPPLHLHGPAHAAGHAGHSPPGGRLAGRGRGFPRPLVSPSPTRKRARASTPVAVSKETHTSTTTPPPRAGSAARARASFSFFPFSQLKRAESAGGSDGSKFMQSRFQLTHVN